MTQTRRQARNQIDQLIKKYQALPTPDRQAVTEAGVVHQFLDPLFAALGWPHTLTDDQVLEHLLALNLQRAAKQEA